MVHVDLNQMRKTFALEPHKSSLGKRVDRCEIVARTQRIVARQIPPRASARPKKFRACSSFSAILGKTDARGTATRIVVPRWIATSVGYHYEKRKSFNLIEPGADHQNSLNFEFSNFYENHRILMRIQCSKK